MAASKYWPSFDLATGYTMPAVAFGALPETTDRENIMTLVDLALTAGYRSFDTTATSVTEAFTAEALRTCLPQHDLTRDDIFLASKLLSVHHGSIRRIVDGFHKSETSLEYPPDLFTINFPPGNTDIQDLRNTKCKHATWAAMAQLYETGQVLSIGLTNFSVADLKKLINEYHSDVPVVNQVIWNPLQHDEELLKYCNENSIVLQGSHSLGDTNTASILNNRFIKEIADDCAASPAQVLLNWSLQRGVAVNPKSRNKQHISQNIELNFSLNKEQIYALDHFGIAPLKNSKDARACCRASLSKNLKQNVAARRKLRRWCYEDREGLRSREANRIYALTRSFLCKRVELLIRRARRQHLFNVDLSRSTHRIPFVDIPEI